MELQRNLPAFERAGVAVFAISYDSVPVLADFAARYHVTYPLLGDEGSHAIRALGLENQHIAEQHTFYGVGLNPNHLGTPYPGTFMLDEQGIVVGKDFEQSYRVRPHVATQVAALAGGDSSDPGVAAQDATGAVRVVAHVDSRTYHTFERLRLDVTIEMAPGVHVYGAPVPAGLTPLAIEMDAVDGLEAGPLELPEPDVRRLEGIGEYVGYEGTVRATRTFHFGLLPGDPRSWRRGAGETMVTVRVRFQACTESECYPPDEVRLELALTRLEHAAAARPMPNAR